MKRLPISIQDNWYSDIHPTWIDSLGIYYPLRPLSYLLRAIEIFLLRRQQLRYWD